MTDDTSQFADTGEQEALPASECGTLADSGLRGRKTPAPIAAGDRFGHYHVLKELGSGAMGTVVEAYDETLDRRVALKVLHDRERQGHERRLVREAQALARLSHANVVQVYEVGKTDQHLFIAMELVVGQTLDEWHNDQRSWREVVEAYVQAGQGLVAAHAQGLIHRDFKPSNCIIDEHGHVKVLDFGLARASDHEDAETATSASYAAFLNELSSTDGTSQSNRALRQALTRTGAVLGTPAYMAPEQLRGGGVTAHSDQFNFCVALYEAVYGTRPFPHGSLGELVSAVIGGKLSPPPANTTAPKAIWPLLRRGLSPKAEERWPSMEALLEHLKRLLAPGTGWRWMAAAGVLAVTATGVALYQGSSTERPCTGAQARISEAWNPERRETVGTAIAATELPFSNYTRQRVEQTLDEYATHWADHYTEICEATHVRQEQSEQTLELRMRCMAERRTALDRTSELLENADAALVENAIGMVNALPPLDRCDDVDTLASVFAPPSDSAAAAEAQSIRDALTHAEALVRAHRDGEATTLIEPLVARADALGYAPLVVDTHHRRGVAYKLSGRLEDARADLTTAFELALEIGHSERVADTSQELTFVVGNMLAKHEAGTAWGIVAEASARKLGPDSMHHARALRSAAIVLIVQGKIDEAAERFEHALRITEAQPGPPGLDLARALGDMGNLHTSRREFNTAREFYTRANEIRVRVFGADHPILGEGEINLGRAAEGLDDLPRAQQHYERALALWEGRKNDDHPDIAIALNNLGVVFDKRGRHAQAIEMHTQALAIREKNLDPDHPFVAQSHVNIGLALRAQGDHQESLGHFIAAYEIAEKSGGPDLEHTLFELSETEFLLGHFDNARAKRERQLKLVRSHEDENSASLAFAEFGLARVQWAQGEHVAARALVDQARKRAEASGPAGEGLRLAIADWLAKH